MDIIRIIFLHQYVNKNETNLDNALCSNLAWKGVKTEYEMTSTTNPKSNDLSVATQCTTPATVSATATAAATKVPKVCYYNNKSSTSSLPSKSQAFKSCIKVNIVLILYCPSPQRFRTI